MFDPEFLSALALTFIESRLVIANSLLDLLTNDYFF